MKRIVSALGFCLITTIMTHAQQVNVGVKQVNIGVNLGIAGLGYQNTNGTNQILSAGSLSLNYIHFVNTHWGIVGGLEIGNYRNKSTLPDGMVLSTNLVDDVGTAFEYKTATQHYREQQDFFMLAIPVMVQYRQNISKKMEWFTNGGVKIHLPISPGYCKVAVDKISIAGFYPSYNVEIKNLPQHGFGELYNWTSSKSNQVKTAAALHMETGFSFKISDDNDRIYAGIYATYGLTDMRNTPQSQPLFAYSPAGLTHLQANCVLNTGNSSARLVSFGIMLRATVN